MPDRLLDGGTRTPINGVRVLAIEEFEGQR